MCNGAGTGPVPVQLLSGDVASGGIPPLRVVALDALDALGMGMGLGIGRLQSVLGSHTCMRPRLALGTSQLDTRGPVPISMVTVFNPAAACRKNERRQRWQVGRPWRRRCQRQ